MAWIERRMGRKKTSYRVHYKDRITGKKRNKSFGLRKHAQSFLETVGSYENIAAQSDANATVQDAMDRWYQLSITIGIDGRPPVEDATAEKYNYQRKIIGGLIGLKKLCVLTKRDCNELPAPLFSNCPHEARSIVELCPNCARNRKRRSSQLSQIA